MTKQSLLLAVVVACATVGGCGPDSGTPGNGLGDRPVQAARGELPAIAEVPPFRLLDQRSRAVELSDLRGKVWIADFIFTRCRTMCPLITQEMAELQDELRTEPYWDEIRLVSFSVDPEHDRPEELLRYAEKHGADPEHWIFLTGTREEIWKLSGEGFRLPVGERPGDAEEPLFHSNRFVLVDRGGSIRGYYPAVEPEGAGELLADLRTVVREGS